MIARRFSFSLFFIRNDVFSLFSECNRYRLCLVSSNVCYSVCFMIEFDTHCYNALLSG